jgi:hypothetical protein
MYKVSARVAATFPVPGGGMILAAGTSIQCGRMLAQTSQKP